MILCSPMIVNLRIELVTSPIFYPTLGLPTSVHCVSWEAQIWIHQLRNHNIEEFTRALISFLFKNSGMGGGFVKLENLPRYIGALSYLIQLTSCVAGDIDQTHLPAQSNGNWEHEFEGSRRDESPRFLTWISVWWSAFKHKREYRGVQTLREKSLIMDILHIRMSWNISTWIYLVSNCIKQSEN